MSRLLITVITLVGVTGIVSEFSHAERRMLHSEMTHLRSGEAREWSHFPEQASGDSLRVAFEATVSQSPQTLGLRRVDVKHGWRVKLNGQTLGQLFSDENDQDEVWQLEPDALRDGTNELVVEAIDDRVDDVLIGEIWLDPRPRDEVFGEAQLNLTAHNDDGHLTPCRFTILNDRGSLSAVGAESDDQLAVRSGVVYTATGSATLGLAAGRYTILCGRGFEYSLEREEIEVVPGDQAAQEFELRREVDTEGWAACDTHVHTFEISRHGDASLDERMITLAGEGVELAVATDHNVFVDYRPHLERIGVKRYLTPIIGNEVTTRNGHFNVFPAAPGADPPHHQAETWEELFESIYQTPDIRVAILNHPRDVHYGFTPFGPENVIAAVGHRLDGRTLQANAIELINSAALQSDPMVVFHDWLTQLNRGRSLTAIGSSDSHEVSRKIVGQGRSYVKVDDHDPGTIDVPAAVDSFVEGRVLVSLGLLTELTVDASAGAGETTPATGDGIDVAVKVQGPGWVTADQVELYANGQRVRSVEIAPSQGAAAGVKAEITWRLDAPTHDLHLVALARGPGVTGLHWPIAKPYQPTSRTWESYVFGSSGAVFVDAEGDGDWTSANDYARRAVDAAGGDFAALLQQLRRFDQATAAFAAHHWVEAGERIRGEPAQSLLKSAPDAVRSGFETYARSQRESLQTR